MKISLWIVSTLILVVGSLFFSGYATAATTSQGRKGLLPPGSRAPDFKLTDVVTGKAVSRDEVMGEKGLLVMFICRHCPFVKHVQGELARLAKDYKPKGVGIVAISSNDPAEYKEDAPGSLKEMAGEQGFTFPFLFDESQDIGRAYTAVATPDLFLFDSSGKLVYRGRVDDTRPGQDRPANGMDIRAAIDAMLAGKPPSEDQKPSIGCSIKWKAGKVPAYAL